jgi:Ca2+/Na+ antiporter
MRGQVDDMLKFLKEQENYIIRTLNSKNDPADLAAMLKDQKAKTRFIQHERLVHLLVTLAFGLFFLLSVFVTLAYEKLEILPLDLLFLLLLVPYIVYYYKLEKGVHRMYELYNMINDKINAPK